MQYSSLTRRLIANFLDALILSIPCWIAAHVIPVLGGLAVLFLYGPVLESSALRATLGKYLMGIQVTDLTGGRISAKAALLRSFLKAVSFMLCLIGFFVALFTERKQTLHDLVADTVVVYGRNEISIVDAWLDQLKAIFGSRHPFSASNASRLEELERLNSLRRNGALTDEEFEREKKRILG